MCLAALATAVAFSVVATAPARAVADRVIGEASGSGLEAAAIAEGDAKRPRALFIQAEATPTQDVRVSWYVVCKYPAFEVQDRKGTFTLQPPFKKKIPFPKKKPLSCGLSVSASIQEGDVHVTLLAR